jgi:hypothetical protein
MRILAILVCSLLIPVAAFSQAGNGTITGTITDSSGASIAGAAVEVKNAETGVIVPAISTGTGAYTAPNLPPGGYSVSVAAAGFKKFTRAGLNLAAAQTLGIDIALEVGATNDTITITAEASLLSTENGDVAHNITVEQLKDLPILGIGGANAGSSGVRNPFNSTVFIPGVNYVANTTMIVNGAPTNTAAYRVEGLDNTNHTVAFALQENQPSADAIQEVAVQTSNYAAEFGQAGGGLFNITMKSGTNQYHGTGYEYFVNEDLNAAYPFSFTPEGNKYRPRNRRNDFGGTIGGPIRIPKLYNGTNKSFFFFSFEEFREASNLTFSDTLPTARYRAGDFSEISPNGSNFNPNLGVPSGSIGTDALGRPILANAIYDPLTRTGNSAEVFSNNIIPTSRISPFALGVQKVLPAPTNGGRTQNYSGSNLSQRISKIPSLKIDHTLTEKDKLSFYWSTTGTDSQYSFPNGNADGLPELITIARGTFIHSATVRLNYDRVLTPTLLFHMGAGYSRISFIDDAPLTRNGGKFDCATLSLAGCFISFNFPTIGAAPIGTTANPMLSSTLGGMQQLGNAQAHTHTLTLRPSFNTNMTWIRGNHAYKAGGEVWLQGNITAPPSGVVLSFNALAANGQPANFGATALPFSPAAGLGGQAMGFPYANFLLGDVTSASQSAPTDSRMGKSQWALFVQDSWKVTRKLTVDYGLRWDYGTANKEQYGRSADLGLIPNAAAGGRIGAPIFEATCNCNFVKNYPYAYGPRIGVAYQLDPKTVIRGGWGLVYGFQSDINVNSAAIQSTTPAGINAFADLSNASVLPRPVWPNFDPAQTPLPGQIVGFAGLTSLDRNAARPPRQNQWSIGIQREIARDFVMEASYVANRGVWWTGPLGYLNQVSPQAFAAVGLNPYTNPADNLLLSSALNSPAVVARIGNYLPYPGYSTSNTLLNALRPYPQFSTMVVTNSPTGKTWYDSMQVKATKRMSHGLQVNGTFTWSKALVLTREDIFNAASSEKSIQTTDQPYLFNANILYQTQKWFKNSIVATATKDWQLGAFVQYASGLPLTPPQATSPNNLGNSEMVRTGQPLYLKDLNCGCINPASDQVLNPAAWANPTAGTFGPGPFTTTVGLQSLLYTDFRQARHPTENFNIGRTFRIKERMALSIRAEFSNIFNRTQIGFPSTTNPLAAPAKNQAGSYTGGFGVVNEITSANAVPSVGTLASSQLYSQPRQGTIIARFIF